MSRQDRVDKHHRHAVGTLLCAAADLRVIYRVVSHSKRWITATHVESGATHRWSTPWCGFPVSEIKDADGWVGIEVADFPRPTLVID